MRKNKLLFIKTTVSGFIYFKLNTFLKQDDSAYICICTYEKVYIHMLMKQDIWQKRVRKIQLYEMQVHITMRLMNITALSKLVLL